jgi:hypothetical protein
MVVDINQGRFGNGGGAWDGVSVNRAAGAGQGGGGGGSGNGTAVPGSPKKPSWAGGSIPSTFDPKDFGTQIFSDAQRIYGQGPRVNPIADYVPYSQETQSLIDRGLADDTALRGGIFGDMAGGDFLGEGNPYLNAEIARTRENVGNDVNSVFASNGRFGADIHAQGLGEGLANAENTARFNQYNTDVGNMFQARGLLDNSSSRALGYSGLLDSKLQEKNQSDSAMWDRRNNAGYNHIAQYLGLLRGGGGNETNQPVSIFDLLGGIGSIAGAFL